MFTNPFERKHSALRQTLDRFLGPESRLSFKWKRGSSKIGSRGNVSGSSSSVYSINSAQSASTISTKSYEKR